jgi:hypothetical protein
MAFVIDDLEPRVVVWQDERDRRRGAGRARHRPATATRAGSRSTSRARRLRALRRPRRPGSAARDADADRPALIIYTAAFDGRPERRDAEPDGDRSGRTWR